MVTADDTFCLPRRYDLLHLPDSDMMALWHTPRCKRACFLSYILHVNGAWYSAERLHRVWALRDSLQDAADALLHDAKHT